MKYLKWKPGSVFVQRNFHRDMIGLSDPYKPVTLNTSKTKTLTHYPQHVLIRLSYPYKSMTRNTPITKHYSPLSTACFWFNWVNHTNQWLSIHLQIKHENIYWQKNQHEINSNSANSKEIILQVFRESYKTSSSWPPSKTMLLTW